MAYKEGVAEILIRVSNLKTKKEKIEASLPHSIRKVKSIAGKISYDQ